MTSHNMKHLLCKKMNLQNCDQDCPRSHNIEQLKIINCIHAGNCINDKCPYKHPNELLSKQQYYDRMYNYVKPYISAYTSICRYIDIGCKIDKCRKAHSIDELVMSECDCYRNECPFFHSNRDENITKEYYFTRMKKWNKTLNKSNKNMLCRYIEIGCQRNDCPYAHSIRELNIHKCIFKNCKSSCIFLHCNETIDKQQYFDRILKYILPIKPFTVVCHNDNCKDNECLFAHSFEEFIISDCIRGNKCKKHCCPFKHPNENYDKKTYYERMMYSMHPN